MLKESSCALDIAQDVTGKRARAMNASVFNILSGYTASRSAVALAHGFQALAVQPTKSKYPEVKPRPITKK
jgi:hypothetical protein